MGIVTVHQKLAPPQTEVADLALHLWQLWHMKQELELKNRYIEVSVLYFTSIYNQNVCMNVTKYGVNFAFFLFFRLLNVFISTYMHLPVIMENVLVLCT